MNRKILITLVACVLLTAPMTAAAFPVNEAAPGFSLPNLGGETIALADHKGRTVLLELGTTWCPGCRAQS